MEMLVAGIFGAGGGVVAKTPWQVRKKKKGKKKRQTASSTNSPGPVRGAYLATCKKLSRTHNPQRLLHRWPGQSLRV